MYGIQYCNEEGIALRWENNYNLLYYVIILNLSFASLHTKKKTTTFCFLLHGSHFLLSVPFEDIFQDDVAIDLQFFKVHSMSMSDIFS